jgi:phage shock protein PspC (stress-responsive transcriptional regulator)
MSQPRTDRDPRRLREWTRSHDERRIAGVCSGLARSFDVPVTAVRLGFVVGSLLPGLHLAGVFLYLALWFLMPSDRGAPSGLDRIVNEVEDLLGDRRDPQRDARDRYDA